MSHQLINHSPDLKKLRDEGYEVEIRSGYLLISHVPYLNSKQEIKFGTLVSELTIAGERTGKPNTHVIHFNGENPCEKSGEVISQIQHSNGDRKLAETITVNHSFSNKPAGGYNNYYDKITRYIEIISAPVSSIDDSITAKSFKVIESEESDSVFEYIDTNSSRAEIVSITDKLKEHNIAIIGLGGTGSYILDFIAKTPVQEIHLFDEDIFCQHNAFRTPGAASIQELNEQPRKVNYLKTIYARMHKNVIPHPENINPSNIDIMSKMDFVFLSIDKSGIKNFLITKLEEYNVPFIDVGMRIEIAGDSLIGILRATTSTENKRDHVRKNGRIPLSENDEEKVYSQNIQIAELNALNAILAVIKWKKICGFYQDLENEFNSTYTINVNMLLNEDHKA